ncbi:hypothetical protein PV325_002371 [Microctonus aethiopoides]|nr:hypothetical protein PV325_002371 [Microctonus aethiopoides]
MTNGGAGLEETNVDKNVESVNHISSLPTLITDIIAFKSSQSLYPLLKPFGNVPRKARPLLRTNPSIEAYILPFIPIIDINEISS